MIVRLWTARATVAGAERYRAHFREEVLPRLRRVPGFADGQLLRQVTGEVVRLVVLTRWASQEAVRAFAGEDPGRAVVAPAAAGMLTSWDRTVEHYEVVAEHG